MFVISEHANDVEPSISRIKEVIRSWELDVLRGNAIRESISHYFEWEKFNALHRQPRITSQFLTLTKIW